MRSEFTSIALESAPDFKFWDRKLSHFYMAAGDCLFVTS